MGEQIKSFFLPLFGWGCESDISSFLGFNFSNFFSQVQSLLFFVPFSSVCIFPPIKTPQPSVMAFFVAAFSFGFEFFSLDVHDDLVRVVLWESISLTESSGVTLGKFFVYIFVCSIF